jgi:hypothetical protein
MLGLCVPPVFSAIAHIAARRPMAVDLLLFLLGGHLGGAVPVTILGTGVVRKPEREDQRSKGADDPDDPRFGVDGLCHGAFSCFRRASFQEASFRWTNTKEAIMNRS